MFKKWLLCLGMLFVSVQAQENCQQEDYQVDIQLAFDELIYTIGMHLAEQQTMSDEVVAKEVLLDVYQQIPSVAQIVTMFLMIDAEMLEHNISTVENLIDYQLAEHRDLAMAAVVWLAAYQDVFTVFTQLHPDGTSFEVWRADLIYLDSINSEEQLEAAGDYGVLYEACSLMLEAQLHFEYEYKLLE